MKKFIKLIMYPFLVFAIILAAGIYFVDFDSSEDDPSKSLNANEDSSYANLTVKPIELTKEEKNASLELANASIKQEDIKNNYKKLFDNKTYTNSEYECNLNKDNVSIDNWFKFQSDYDEQLQKAIDRGENFLMYSEHYLKNEKYDYDQPLIYGYVQGLGYLIGIWDDSSFSQTGGIGTLEICVENKYFFKMRQYNHTKSESGNNGNSTELVDEYINDIVTLKANNDIIKAPIGVIKRKVVYSDYKDNMISATISSLTKNDYDDYADLYNYGYNFFESDFMYNADNQTTQHLYGIGINKNLDSGATSYDDDDVNKEFPIYDIEKDERFFWTSNTRCLTDFNNIFVSFKKYDETTGSQINYALFGEVADVYLKKIVDTMFSVDIKDCNNFSKDIFLKDREYRDSYYEGEKQIWEAYYSKNIFEDCFWTITNNETYVKSDTNQSFIGYIVMDDKLTVKQWEKGRERYDGYQKIIILKKEIKESYFEYAKRILGEIRKDITYSYDEDSKCWLAYNDDYPDGEKWYIILEKYASRIPNEEANIFDSRFN